VSRGRGEVTLDGIRKSFGTVAAADDVSFHVEGGQFFSLLGPSGCGKTTILRIIAGFERPDSGSVLLDGVSVQDTPPYRRDVNTVFQQYALFPHLTVVENVAFGLEVKGTPRREARTRAESALERVKLPGYGSRRTSQLSGGEQQRVALARALVNRPSLLLLDEPLAALDLKLRKQMQEELKALQRDVGITFLYVTHDQEEAMTLSDRIAVMRAGRVQQMGSAEEIYAMPRNRFVADFIGTTNFVEGDVVRRNGRSVLLAVPNGESRHELWATAAASTADGARVAASLRPERIAVRTTGNGDADPAVNRVDGTVAEAVYLGASVRYRIALGPGFSLLAQSSSDPGTCRFPAGTRVSVAWSPEDLRVLEDDGLWERDDATAP